MTESNDQETTALKCDCSAEDIVFLPCSGASNCGQITNQAVVEKNHQFNIAPEEVELVAQRTKQLLSKPARARM